MLNCGEIICFCVRFCIWFGLVFVDLDACMHRVQNIHVPFFLSLCVVERVGQIYPYCVCGVIYIYFFSLVIVVVGDLGASFIIVSANTKLDIKIDTSNDQ